MTPARISTAMIRAGDRVTVTGGHRGTVVRAWRPLWGLGLRRLYQVKLDGGGLRGGQAQLLVGRRELTPKQGVGP
jgi:hypothetical protein